MHVGMHGILGTGLNKHDRPVHRAIKSIQVMQASAIDASEERDSALGQLEPLEEQLRELQAQSEQATQLRTRLGEVEVQLSDAQSTAQKLRLELESQLQSRDAQVHVRQHGASWSIPRRQMLAAAVHPI